METVRDFIFLGSKIAANGDCSHEIKRRLILGRKIVRNPDSLLKSRDTILATKVHIIRAMIFPIVEYRCNSWTIKNAESQNIYVIELWCWRRLLRDRERRSNQGILKEINAEYSLERLVLRLKVQYFAQLMRRFDPLEKTLMLGKIEGRRRKGKKWMQWLDVIIYMNNMSLSKFWETVKNREA